MSKLTIHTKLQFDDKVIAEGDLDEIQDCIMKIIKMLPEKCQNVFYLTIVHGMSDVEAGQFIKSSAQEVRDRMEEAMRWIRENVGKIRKVVRA